ncbi:saccharopine dehydrogenase family protein [Antrihabitans stalactiti]|uniref:Saccharopine dehydrogenase n=1 Tax=Antrihabitans stalactiti TaxID=2584121 RepID=A0A848KIL3_9NOCA|nr:saccharopine dehydrogenase NADP-binding domain-containing protein [Antrihabitans stalactiti]NMN98913.1 saccharopine dehydrogenase [Antrihabitans stalactiti]
MTARILLFGATGYTGDLTARALVRRGASPVLVARSADRVANLAAELGGLDTEVANAADPASVAAVVRRGDVLISTVGPFLRFGEPAVRAAAEVGAHYFDSTGEGPFIKDVFDRFGPVAEKTGAALVPAFGFDFVPGALAGALALRKAGQDAVTVDVGYFVSQFGTSGGTRASVAGVMLEEGFAFRDGEVRTERTGRRTRGFDVRGKNMHAVSVPGAEHFTLPAIHPTLRDVGVFLGAPQALARGMSVSTLLSTPVRRVAPLKAIAGAVANKFVTGSSGGPSAEHRAKSSVTVVAEATSATGEILATVTLAGPDPYDFTADILAWGATTAAEGKLRGSGALGPVGAFGLDELVEGCAAVGLREV